MLGCFFHLGQLLFRKIQEGLQKYYVEKENICASVTLWISFLTAK